MESYTLEDLSLREVKALLVGIKEISIKGIDAMFIGTLQIKLQEQITQIEEHINSSNTPLPPPLIEVN
jgi:hypothetical protein|tara:strand:+ start:2306 stop:2509 length:204 start_codon:yes stop_codon:yes gene_type:complete